MHNPKMKLREQIYVQKHQKEYLGQVPVAHALILATKEAEIRRIVVRSQPR
jgi:hypothetical protein